MQGKSKVELAVFYRVYNTNGCIMFEINCIVHSVTL